MAGADAMASVRLVAGLGNPGREYSATRHNAGFWFADALASRLGTAFRSEGKFQAHVAKAAGDLRLLKPSTYMNLSGRAVGAAARFFGITPDEILVVHDELDLLPGEAKMKFGGGIAGHNGLRDIAGQLGTPEFWRLRIGIGHPRDSAIPQQDVADYVLAPPATGEGTVIEAAIDRALEAWPAIGAGEFERAMLLLHTKKEKP
jgi:peptidyl-tRNA hydrolase, PTH1 family